MRLRLNDLEFQDHGLPPKLMRKMICQKTVTPHYLPKVRESAPAKPHHVNAPSSSRNSKKESYGSNDMAHTYFLEEIRKKTQDRNRIPNPRDMASARTQRTPNACTPKPRNISRKPSHKTTTRYKPIEKTSNTKKSGRQIAIGQRLLVLGGYLLERCSPITAKVDSKPPNGSNKDITNPYECDQTLNVSAGTLNLSAGPGPQLMTPGTINSGLVQNIPSPTPAVPPTKIDWDSLFQPRFDEYFKPPSNVDHPVPTASTSSPSSTTVDQDAPSTSTSQTTSKQQSSVIPQGVEVDFYDIEVAHMDN
ncbi:hypothetical protein Tco_1145445 [Tanacetum coccineum]